MVGGKEVIGMREGGVFFCTNDVGVSRHQIPSIVTLWVDGKHCHGIG